MQKRKDGYDQGNSTHQVTGRAFAFHFFGKFELNPQVPFQKTFIIMRTGIVLPELWIFNIKGLDFVATNIVFLQYHMMKTRQSL